MKIESKYRIVSDNYGGFEAQVKHWWFPLFWFEVSDNGIPWPFGSNTNFSIEEAKSFICDYKRGTLKRKNQSRKALWISDQDKQFCQ